MYIIQLCRIKTHVVYSWQAEEVEEKVENLLERVLQDREAKEVEHEPINAQK